MRLKGKMFMAVGQDGNIFHGLRHPRKDLMDLFGVRHASKMYEETASGKSQHVGYVVGGRWISVYRVTPFKEEE